MNSISSAVIRALQEIGVNPTAEDIADIIWLTSYMMQDDISPDVYDYNPDQQTIADIRSLDTTDHPLENEQALVDLPYPSEGESLLPAHDNSKPEVELHPPASKSNLNETSTIAGMHRSTQGIVTTGVTALPHKIEISRSLRPIAKKTSSKTRFVFDEQSSASRIAEIEMMTLVYKPELERELSAILLVDAWSSMAVWYQTVQEFRQLLLQLGAFRTLRTCKLVTNPDDFRVHIVSDQSSSIERWLDPGELIDSTGRTVVFVLTDLESPAWGNNNMADILTVLGRSQHVAILSLLPESQWSQTVLSEAVPVYLRTKKRLAANGKFPDRYHDKFQVEFPPWFLQEQPFRTVPFPIMSLEPTLLESWVSVFSGDATAEIPAYYFPETGSASIQEIPDKFTDALWRHFRTTTSPTARQLAGYLAAVPLTLPIMRLVQRTLLPESKQAHLAEILNSRLVRLDKQESETHPNRMRWEFVEGAREKLLTTVLLGKVERVLKEVSSYLEAHSDQAYGFHSYLFAPDGTSDSGSITIDDQSLPFARIAVTTLAHLGYEKIASELTREIDHATKKPDSEKDIETKDDTAIQNASSDRTASELSQNTLVEEPDITLPEKIPDYLTSVHTEIQSEDLAALVIGLGGTGQEITSYVKKNLLETQSVLPNNIRLLVFDTAGEPDPYTGHFGRSRYSLNAAESVQLDPGEYVYVGGDIYRYVSEVAGGSHPHIGSWLQADWYLRSLPRNLFSLTEGAGQLRQFGRMALFNDVTSLSNSRILGTLRSAIELLQRQNPSVNQLQVFLTGSTVGGTGAGMFVDIAHIIRQIATETRSNIKIVLRGFMVLPPAFSDVVRSDMLRHLNASSFAAMRELRRIMTEHDYETSYPMIYISGNRNRLPNGSISRHLFDSLYYFDGYGRKSPRGNIAIKELGSVLADTIVANIDQNAGPMLLQHSINLQQETNLRTRSGEMKKKKSFISSFGTYSVIFPIRNIVEKWSHQLGLEILHVLTAPETFDEQSNQPASLNSYANAEIDGNGRFYAKQFLTSGKFVSYKDQVVEPTPIMVEFARIAQIAQDERRTSEYLKILLAQNITDWKSFYDFESQHDYEWLQLKQRMQYLLDQKRLSDQIVTSDSFKEQEDLLDGARRIIKTANNSINQYLGVKDSPDGQRSGGEYARAIIEISNFHVDRFIRLLDLKIVEILNGNQSKPSVAKGGKIGYLKDFLVELHLEMNQTIAIFGELVDLRLRDGDQRKSKLAKVQRTEVELMEVSSKKAGFLNLGRSFRNATNAQSKYIEAQTELIEILMLEELERVLLYTARRINEYIEGALKAVDEWIDTLVLGNRSFYYLLQQVLLQLEAERAAAKEIATHRIIDDTAYEQIRYEHYLASKDIDQREALLGSIQWSIDHKMVSGRQRLRLNLSLEAENNSVHLLPGDEFAHNTKTLLNLTRQVFAQAYQSESLISYLMENDNSGEAAAYQLAREISQNSSVFLDHDSRHTLQTIYLIVVYDEKDTAQQNYLGFILKELAQLKGARTVSSGKRGVSEGRFIHPLNSGDPFKLIMISSEDAVELESLKSFRNGKAAYLGEARSSLEDRRRLHIFPAEVHTTSFEVRLPELGQRERILSDAVTLTLEYPELVRSFALAYAYGLIERSFESDRNGQDQPYWRIFFPEESKYKKSAGQAEFRLTKLGDSNLLDALHTYTYTRRDVRYKDGYDQTIDYRLVEQMVNGKRSEDESMAGLREFLDDLENNLLPSYSKDLTENQDMYDLFSVFALIFRDEIRRTRDINNPFL